MYDFCCNCLILILIWSLPAKRGWGHLHIAANLVVGQAEVCDLRGFEPYRLALAISSGGWRSMWKTNIYINFYFIIIHIYNWMCMYMRRLCRGTQFQIPFLLPSATCSNMVFYDPLKLGQLSVMRTEPKLSRCKWLVQSEKIALFFGISPKHQCFFWKWFQSQDLLGKPVLRSYAHDSATFYACNIFAMQNWSKFKDPDPYLSPLCR